MREGSHHPSDSTPPEAIAIVILRHRHRHRHRFSLRFPPVSPYPVMASPIEDIEYESLPVGAGWGVNMLAGAMAGISEHAVIYPVDSIKVSTSMIGCKVPCNHQTASSTLLNTPPAPAPTHTKKKNYIYISLPHFSTDSNANPTFTHSLIPLFHSHLLGTSLPRPTLPPHFRS